MKIQNIRFIITTFVLSALFVTPLSAQERGLDERINEAFTPIADWWGNVVLHNFPGTEIPTIIFLLVGGALFFTFYFGFINIRGFGMAINTVRGKYDSLDHHEALTDDLAIDGDIKDTIRDESEEGEGHHGGKDKPKKKGGHGHGHSKVF